VTLSLQVEDVIAESTDEEAGLTDKNSANVCLCQLWLLMLTVLTHYIVGCCYQMHCMAHLGYWRQKADERLGKYPPKVSKSF